MDAESRDMVLEYYRGRRQVKIQARKALAERMGISLAALRLRTQRARSTLKKCILECMERKARERH
jgi:DNA-directed RNA polymerase specialized sigma24 family protein